jgi:hypothetical protein
MFCSKAIAVTFILLMAENAVSAASKFEELPANVRAVRNVLSGPKTSDPAFSGVLLSRVKAIRALETRFSPPGASLPTAPGFSAPPSVSVRVDKAARVAGVTVFSPKGLGLIGQPRKLSVNAALASLRKFVQDNPSLYDLQGGTIAERPELDWLTVRDFSENELKGGHLVQRLRLAQSIHGLPVMESDMNVMFHDGVLISVNGPLFNPAAAAAWSRKTVAKDAAIAAALKRDESLLKAGVARQDAELLWDAERSRAVYLIRNRTTAPDHKLAGVVHIVDAETAVELETRQELHADSPDFSQPEVLRDYLVFQPLPTDPRPLLANPANLQTRGWLGLQESGSVFWPWDKGNAGFTHPTAVYSFASGTTATPLAFGGSFRFTPSEAPGDNGAFAVQHTALWSMHAAQVAGYQFKGYYNAAVANDPLRVVVGWKGSPAGSSRYWRKGTCPFSGFSEDCVGINGAVQPVEGTNFSGIGVILHEYGHSVSNRMLWPNHRLASTCESGSVEENSAAMFAMTAIMWQYGITANFTDYDGHPSIFTGAAQGALDELGHPTARVHLNNNAQIACYNAPPQPCAGTSTSLYTFGEPMIQAFWEAAHSVNCGSGTCVGLGDGSIHWDSGAALAYAMFATPAGNDFVQFTANFLAYYYYNVGFTAWNNRWWIFNHHRLVGPNYGYTCAANTN